MPDGAPAVVEPPSTVHPQLPNSMVLSIMPGGGCPVGAPTAAVEVDEAASEAESVMGAQDQEAGIPNADVLVVGDQVLEALSQEVESGQSEFQEWDVVMGLNGAFVDPDLPL